MTDSEDLFREKHEGPSFTEFDEDTIAHVSSKYKHLKIYFWDGTRGSIKAPLRLQRARCVRSSAPPPHP